MMLQGIRKSTPGATCFVAETTNPKPVAETLNSFFSVIGLTLAAKLVPF